jgi:hypothetical protein
VTTPSGVITEYPISTFRWITKQNLPVGGGGYLRMLPFWYTRMGFRSASNEQLPLIAYIHPWEVDPEQPRLSGRLKSRLRHYTNLGSTHDRLRRLLALGDFSSFRDSGLESAATEIDLHAEVS